MTSYAEVILAVARRANVLDGSSAPGPGLAVGSTGERGAQEAEALRILLRRLHKGDSLDDAAEAARSGIREVIARHNARRAGDINWQVWEGSYDTAIEYAVANIRRALPSPEQEAA